MFVFEVFVVITRLSLMFIVVVIICLVFIFLLWSRGSSLASILLWISYCRLQDNMWRKMQIRIPPKRMLRAFNIYCTKCNCVPPGTFGNKDLCPCYADMKTHGNKLKCPWMWYMEFVTFVGLSSFKTQLLVIDIGI